MIQQVYFDAGKIQEGIYKVVPYIEQKPFSFDDSVKAIQRVSE